MYSGGGMGKTKLQALFTWMIAYSAAGFAAYGTAALFGDSGSIVATAFWADSAATAVIFAASLQRRNSSMYDAYWSIAPVIILFYWALNAASISAAAPVRRVVWLFLAAMTVWGFRLTFNCLRRWKGIHDEDWRYKMLKERYRRWSVIVDLFGIHLLPTIVVFIALLPAAFLFGHIGGGYGEAGVSWISWPVFIGSCVILAGTMVELAADEQLRRFRMEFGNNGIIQSGLWQRVRHPNYLGELMVWWGVWIAGLSRAPLYTILCPLIMTLLFVKISIPLMEKHLLEKRPQYRRVIETLPALLPFSSSGKKEPYT